jgi:hypothetical protein
MKQYLTVFYRFPWPRSATGSVGSWSWSENAWTSLRHKLWGPPVKQKSWYSCGRKHPRCHKFVSRVSTIPWLSPVLSCSDIVSSFQVPRSSTLRLEVFAHRSIGHDTYIGGTEDTVHDLVSLAEANNGGVHHPAFSMVQITELYASRHPFTL